MMEWHRITLAVELAKFAGRESYVWSDRQVKVRSGNTVLIFDIGGNKSDHRRVSYVKASSISARSDAQRIRRQPWENSYENWQTLGRRPFASGEAVNNSACVIHSAMS